MSSLYIKLTTKSPYFFLTITVVLVFMYVNRLFLIDNWLIPFGYETDSVYSLTYLKLFSTNEFLPFKEKFISSLNAPFGANWSDWPTADDIMWFFLSLPARVFGVYAGSNIIILISLLANAITFYYVATRFKYSRFLSFCGAFSFATSHFFFSRGLLHLIFINVWHVLLFFLFIKKISTKQSIDKKEALFFFVLAFCFGSLATYYAYFFLQIMVFIIIYDLINKNYNRVFIHIVSCIICLLPILIDQMDTKAYQKINGPNSTVAARSLKDVEQYALQLPALFLPQSHRVQAFQDYSNKKFHDVISSNNENIHTYMGLTGTLCFFFTLMFIILKSLNSSKTQFNFLEKIFIWLLILSLVGGLNMVLSILTDQNYFRAINRFSIIIQAAVLLNTLRFLSKQKRSIQTASGLLILIFTFLDLPKVRTVASMKAMKHEITKDQDIVNILAQQLGSEAKVFQLPVVDFPESPNLYKMKDYEHLKMFLNSHNNNLKWSYGGVKGRVDNNWQVNLLKQPIHVIVDKLKSYGFNALAINLKAYSPIDLNFIDKLNQLKDIEIIHSNYENDFALYKLKPILKPIKPTYLFGFEAGWNHIEQNPEYTRYRSDKAGTFVLYNDSEVIQSTTLQLNIESVLDQNLTLFDNYEASTSFHVKDKTTLSIAITLKPGRNVFKLVSQKNAIKIYPDHRYLNFAVTGLQLNK